jgi:uncharacterized protein
MRMRSLALPLVILAVVVAGAPPARAETPIPAPPDRWVTDQAGFLSPQAADELEARLAAYERGTGHQLIVYIDRTTGGVPIEDWAARAFERWRVGRKGIDDGLALFVFSDDRRARIEVGYGLEERVPDVIAGRIIQAQIVPRIRAGDRDGAIRAGVESLMTTIGGAGGAPAAPPKQVPRWGVSLGGLLLLFLLAGLFTHSRLGGLLLLLSIGSGRGGGWRGGGGGFGGGGFGGGGFGGGGFSGGGGRSGGGGASGSW